MSARLRIPFALGLAFLMACTESAVEPEPEPEPPPPPPPEYLDIAAGPDRSCAIQADRGVVCWGRRLFGGQPGAIALTPVAVPGLTARAVALGGDHNCAVQDDGSAVCWGANQHGQGGRADTSHARLPQAVEDTLLFARVAVGVRHSCALTEEDDLWCWGHGSRGSIGTPDLSDSHAPFLLGGGSRRYVYFDVAGHHGCAIGADSEVYCWGWNAHGQLGVGVHFDLGSPERIARPGPYAGVYTGEHHSCALDLDGNAWCWGRGDNGQLGHGGIESSAVPVAVTGGHRFVRLTLGLDHSCGILIDRTAYCWGHNRYGRLGTGGLETVAPVPTAVQTELRFERISASDRHTCAISTERHAYCWGHGGFGQLGTGTSMSAPLPTLVAPPDD